MKPVSHIPYRTTRLLVKTIFVVAVSLAALSCNTSDGKADASSAVSSRRITFNPVMNQLARPTASERGSLPVQCIVTAGDKTTATDMMLDYTVSDISATGKGGISRKDASATFPYDKIYILAQTCPDASFDSNVTYYIGSVNEEELNTVAYNLTDGTWEGDTQYTFPESGYIRFFALVNDVTDCKYFSYDSSDGSFYYNEEGYANTGDADTEFDFIMARSGAIDCSSITNRTVTLAFDHLLTSIGFDVTQDFLEYLYDLYTDQHMFCETDEYFLGDDTILADHETERDCDGDQVLALGGLSMNVPGIYDEGYYHYMEDYWNYYGEKDVDVFDLIFHDVEDHDQILLETKDKIGDNFSSIQADIRSHSFMTVPQTFAAFSVSTYVQYVSTVYNADTGKRSERQNTLDELAEHITFTFGSAELQAGYKYTITLTAPEQ